MRKCIVLLILLFFYISVTSHNINPANAISTVGTSTTSDATASSMQRKTFYQNGRFWVFYSDGTNIVYKTSTSGVDGSWTSATTIRSGDSGLEFSVFFDGGYLHYAYQTYSAVYYRKGIADYDGTITWYDSEQTAYSGTTDDPAIPSIGVDSGGYPFIAFPKYWSATKTLPMITKSSLVNGSWSTASGFPYNLSQTSSETWYTNIASLTSWKMYAIYMMWNSTTFKGQLWNGTHWNSEESVTTTRIMDAGSLVPINNDIHLTYLTSTSYNVAYIKRTYGSGWGSEVTLSSSEDITSRPTITKNENDLYVFWTNSDTFYYKSYLSGSWQSTETWFTDSIMEDSGGRLTSFYQAFNNKIGIIWTTSSGFNVKFEKLTFKLNLRIKTTNGYILTDSIVTIDNGTEYSQTVSSAGWANFTGQELLSVDVSVTWQSLLVNTFTIDISEDENRDVTTFAQRLTSDSYYLLFALNNTQLPSPEIVGSYNWQIPSVTATGTIPFKMDNTNWIKTDEPYAFTVGTSTYTRGTGSWSFSSNIFAFNVPFSIKTLSMTWDTQTGTGESGGGSGGGGGGWTPEEIIPSPEEIVEEVAEAIPTIAGPGLITPGIIIIVSVVGGSIAYGELKRKRPTPRNVWSEKKRAKSKAIKWKKPKPKTVKWKKEEKSKKIDWKKPNRFD